LRVAGVISDKVNLWHEVADADAGWVTPAEAGPFATAILAALGDVDGARGAVHRSANVSNGLRLATLWRMPMPPSSELAKVPVSVIVPTKDEERNIAIFLPGRSGNSSISISANAEFSTDVAACATAC